MENPSQQVQNGTSISKGLCGDGFKDVQNCALQAYRILYNTYLVQFTQFVKCAP